MQVKVNDKAAAHEHRFEVVRLYEGKELPSVSDVDWAVVMGGPMSVNDEAHFPMAMHTLLDEMEQTTRKKVFVGG